jgi:arginase
MQPQAANFQTKQIAIISASIGWGSMHEAAERGPALLFKQGLAERIGASIVDIKAIPAMAEGALDYDETEKAIMDHASRVSDAVCSAIHDGFFPVVVGGDHTSALGFHSGLGRAFGETGIVWVDTHPDLNTKETSPSGHMHGMVLAGLLGKGSTRMLETTSACQTQEAHVAMVGTRDIDAGEQRRIDEGNITCMTMDMVHKHGLGQCMHDAVAIANNAKAGYGLSIDIDVIDPSQAPFVATPVADGLDAVELALELSRLPHHERLLGMEVVEFTPRNDNDAEMACNLIASLITAVAAAPV